MRVSGLQSGTGRGRAVPVAPLVAAPGCPELSLALILFSVGVCAAQSKHERKKRVGIRIQSMALAIAVGKGGVHNTGRVSTSRQRLCPAVTSLRITTGTWQCNEQWPGRELMVKG